MKNSNFEVCVRGIIKKNGKILVCKRKDKDYYFFPGGHVEFGEQTEDALRRELKEELNLSIKNISFIGVSENIYQEDGRKIHEINLVFNVSTDKVEDKSQENHIDFFFLDKEKFSKEKILPIALRKAIIRWQEDKKIFWASKNEIKENLRKKKTKRDKTVYIGGEGGQIGGNLLR